MLKRMLNWMNNQHYSSTEMFKVLDQNFDGVVDIQDLKQFLQTIMGINEDEIQQTKIERLFALLDTAKCGKIYQMDFEKFINSLTSNNNQTSSFNVTQISRSKQSQSQMRTVKTGTV